MNNRDIEQKLRTAVCRTVPDVLDAVLEQCNAQKGTITHMQIIKKPKKWLRTAMGVAAALVVAVGGLFAAGQYRSAHAVDSIISFDVNPSIELRLNNAESVISVSALNDDALTILDGMDLKGVHLDVAVNALIGSMLKNGYISELSNSIMISVENQDNTKSTALQKHLTEEINAILSASAIDPAILSQATTGDTALQTLSDNYGISKGKAALIQKIVLQSPLYTVEDLVALNINDLNLIASIKNTDLQDINSTGTASDKSYIGTESAKQAALTAAGVNVGQISRLEISMDYEDGRMVYEVEFYVGSTEYEYEIDAVTGGILNTEIDDTAVDNSEGSTAANTHSYIGEKNAMSLALSHAGLSAATVIWYDTELDTDDGSPHYEIEFRTDAAEYDYKIDAITGSILKVETEALGAAPVSPAVSPTPDNSSGQGSSSNYIGEAKAQSIALTHAGLSTATDIHTEFSHDDGRAVYEVAFITSALEFEYEIDAVTGAILDFDRDALDD